MYKIDKRSIDNFTYYFQMSEDYREEQMGSFDNQNFKPKQIKDVQTNVSCLRIIVYVNTIFMVLMMIVIGYLIGQVSKNKAISTGYSNSLTQQYNKSKEQIENLFNQYGDLKQDLQSYLSKLSGSMDTMESIKYTEIINNMILQLENESQAIERELIRMKDKIQTLQFYVFKREGNPYSTTNVSSSLLVPVLQNKKGEALETYLYNAQEWVARTNLISKRLNLFKKYNDSHPDIKNKDGLLMAKYTLKSNHQQDDIQRQQQTQQYNRLEDLYRMSQFQNELSMCIIGVGRNNAADFRIQANLNSIFMQNYSNYYAVIIDDVSVDGSQAIYQKYFNFFEIPERKYIFIKNQQRITALENIDIAIHRYCGNRDIFVLVDLDDQIIGKNTLKLFNTFYLRYGSGMVYSNFYSNGNYTDLALGFTKQYSEDTMKARTFRSQRLYFSHLRTARIDLYKKIKGQDLKHENGTFYKTFYDLAIFFPIIEMCSCGKVKRIDEQTYFYNYVTAESDRKNTDFKRKQVHDKVVATKPYECEIIEPFHIQKLYQQDSQLKKQKDGSKIVYP